MISFCPLLIETAFAAAAAAAAFFSFEMIA